MMGERAKDYRLEIKVKNARLFRLMENMGIETVSELARLVGSNPSSVGEVANMKLAPIGLSGRIRGIYQTLMDYFGCDIFDLVPEQHMLEALDKNVAKFDVDLEDLPGLTAPPPPPSPELIARTTEGNRLLLGALDSLTERQKFLLEKRYGLNGGEVETYKELSKKLGIGVERTRQIEAQALQRLRHPKRVRGLRDHPALDDVKTGRP